MRLKYSIPKVIKLVSQIEEEVFTTQRVLELWEAKYTAPLCARSISQILKSSKHFEKVGEFVPYESTGNLSLWAIKEGGLNC